MGEKNNAYTSLSDPQRLKSSPAQHHCLTSFPSLPPYLPQRSQVGNRLHSLAEPHLISCSRKKGQEKTGGEKYGSGSSTGAT